MLAFDRFPAADGALQNEATELINRMRGINRVVARVASHVPLAEMRVFSSTLSPERLARLRRADAIVRRLSHESGFDKKVWQFPVVLIPVGSAGRPDSVVLRPIDSVDGMTAQSVSMDEPLLQRYGRRTPRSRRRLRRVLRSDAQAASHHRVGVKRVTSLPSLYSAG